MRSLAPSFKRRNSVAARPSTAKSSGLKPSTTLLCIVLALLLPLAAKAETMVQYFNTSWTEITAKMPELAEAGYGAIWLPPPTKGSGGLSVGYDMWDPFDLGSKDQRNSVRTRYGTEAELIKLVETAHRFGIRIYFDNIMNHRAFDVPGYNENTPIDTYPGMVPEDFHLRVTQDGFYRKWDNTRSWNDAWQVQNLGLADLIDIAQEPGTTNQNFGSSEGGTWPKVKFIRDLTRPENYCYLPNGTYVGFGPNNGITTAILQANESFYSEYVQDYQNRAARFLIDRTKADGLRLDAVKHVRADFFGATYGAGKDSDDYGYGGQVQRQFNISRGFSDSNHRDTLFNTELGRDDAMMFGEHLGEPPAYGPYIDSGMRLVDNPLREQLNSRLGNGYSSLAGYDQPGYGGFSAAQGVMHAQSHDSDYAARRELQHAIYFTREGMGLIYTDGNYQAETLGESGGAFPRHANTSFLGQWNDQRVPNLLHLHDQFARGYQKGAWSDANFLAYERIDKRENGSMTDANGVTMLLMLNDDYDNGQRPFDRASFSCSFPPNAYLWQYARGSASNGDSMVGFYVTTLDANNGRSYFPSSVIVPRGGYYIFSWKNPDPSTLWSGHGGRPITIMQGGVEAGTVAVSRRDGPNGDPAFNGNPLSEAARPILPADIVTTDYKYTATVPRITSGTAVRFVARTDGSAENVLLKLDGGMNLNSLSHALGDTRDNPPALSTDTFQGYEQPTFVSRIHPELFAAQNTVRCDTGSAGAETFTSTGVLAQGYAGGAYIDGNTAAFLYHDPANVVGNISPTRNQYDATANQLWAKSNSVGGGYKMWLYYTNDLSNVEGSAGLGKATTKTVELHFDHNDDSGATDWWQCTLPGDFTATTRYKLSLYKDAAPSWFPGDAASATRKLKMQTTFQTSERNLTTSPFRPHNDYGEQRTGLEEGFHVIRARAFLNRPGQTSIYNTFTQTFYFDAQAATGEIRFPQTNGDTVGGNEYGSVIRTDASVTEVWYNIDDTDANNDDSTTRSVSGNGGGFEPFTDSNSNGQHEVTEKYQDLNENGVWDSTLATSWVKASEVTPSPAITPSNAAFVKEWRFTYANIPPSGTATIKVRLRELSSSVYKDFALGDNAGHYTTLERTVTAAGPDYRVFVAYPQANGDSVDDNYVMKVFFTKSLADGLTTPQLIEKFTVRIGANTDAIGAAIARDAFTIVYHGNESPYHELAIPLHNLYNDQPDYLHKIEVTYDRTSPAADLITTRVVKALPSSKPRVSIVTPPELDSDGKAFDIVLKDKLAPTAEERSYIVRVATSTDATAVTLAVVSGSITFSAPVTSTEAGSKYWDFTWSNMTAGTFRFTATVTSPLGTNIDSRRATVILRDVLAVNANDPDDDDDGLLDADESTATPLPNGYATDDAKYKPNAEQWTNGEVHIHFAYGRSNPTTPDSDADGLPDALEVGWRNATIIGEAFTDTGYGATNTGAGNGVFDWDDTNLNGIHNVGETSEPYTDTNANNVFNWGTIIGRDTNGDGTPNFVGDIDPPFFNTLDNLGLVPGVNTAAEGGDRSKTLRGSMTDPNNADTDSDGIKDGIEDANRNGWLDGDGESIPANFNPWLARNWPNGVRNPGETWIETSPTKADTDGDGASDGYGEDKNFNGLIAGDVNNDRVWIAGEFWTETDPLNIDSDGDGLPDGWEIKYGLDPLDDGTISRRTGLTGDPINGPAGNPDGDLFNNGQELANGTNPKTNDTLPPTPPGAIVIGPTTPSIIAGGVTNLRDFTDWKIEDLIALDAYEGDGSNNQGTDVYPAGDGYDSSRDLVAFYAHDGGATSASGDGLFHFRVDLEDLKAYAEEANLNIYVVMDFGSPAVGEYALPGDIDTGTDMHWEACVACYATDNGAVFVDTNHGSNSTAINQGLAPFGVLTRTQADADGFKRSYFSSDLDAVEFSISRQALLDAGWNGNASTINYQVFTTKDGTINSPVGAGDLGGRSDIRDSIYDDVIASAYWRDQSSISGQYAVLHNWFGVSAGNDRFKRAKVISLIHEARPILPGNQVQALINNGAGAGFYRPLDVHEAYGVPMTLHITPTLASALQWAKVDPVVNKPWRDGPTLNTRLGNLATAGIVQFSGTTYADHLLPYFPLAYTQQNVTEAASFMQSVYGSSPSTSLLYSPERVLSSDALSTIQGMGFTATFADQSRHLEKWFGRSTSLGSDGYRINRVNGIKLIPISDSTSTFRFINLDNGLGQSLREALSRKARSSTQDQVIVLHSEWSDFTNKTQADAYDLNIRWIASHPWVQLVTPDQILSGQIDSNNDGIANAWPVVEHGTMTLATVAKDYIQHATQENYDNWFYGQSGREESLRDKVFNIRTSTTMPTAWGQVGVSGIANTAWLSASSLLPANPLRSLARESFHASTWLTAFHNQSNGDLTRFSTGSYVYPDTTYQDLAGFSKVAQSQARWANVYQRVTTWATAANAGAYASTSATESSDVDLDGEPEYPIFNNRIFALFERIGGRMTAAWVRDLSNGKVFQVAGNPMSYSGYETEEEGYANVVGGLVGSYRTSGFKDWFASGTNSIAYNNDWYAVSATSNGWVFTSSDGKVAKTITLAPYSNSLRATYVLGSGITTQYVRFGLSPHLQHLLKTGQSGMSDVVSTGSVIGVTTTATDGIVRAYARTIGAGLSGTTWVSAAVDDDAGQSAVFDTINMRNQAQTQQIELSGATGMTFALGFETGPTLTLDSDGDGLPDAWEAANVLNGSSSAGSNGANGDPDNDGLTNTQEYIVGKNPQTNDSYTAGVAKTGSGFDVTFGTVADRFYRVYSSSDLVDWNPIGSDVLGDGSTQTVSDATSATRKFYRVEVRLVNP